MECLCHVNLPCWCLGGVYQPSVTMGASLRALKQAEICPKEQFSFVYALKRVVCTLPIVSLHMECLFHVNLACWCQGGVYHPSVTMGAPLRALKQAEIRTKEQFSFVHALKRVVCTIPIVLSHMECLCCVNLPFWCLGGEYHPSVTMGAPLRAPKQAEIGPKEWISLVRALRG